MTATTDIVVDSLGSINPHRYLVKPLARAFETCPFQ